MINGPVAVFVEHAGRIAALEASKLTSEAVARATIEIARPLGKDFSALRVPVIEGREFDASDRSGEVEVALVNEAFVRRFWPRSTTGRGSAHRRGLSGDSDSGGRGRRG